MQPKSTLTDPTDLRGHEREAEAEDAEALEKRRKQLEDVKWLMAHPQGRRLAARILDQAGVNRSSFNHSGSLMAFNEGRRDIGLWFTAEMLESAPEGYFKLLKEYKGE